MKNFILEGKNYLFDLNDFGILTVSGNQAGPFLQGQMTCDIREVNATAMRQGAFCNLKGRVLALADVISCHGYHLVLLENLMELMVRSLEKTALLSRVTLKKADNYHVYGFYHGNKNEPLTDFVLPSGLFALTKSKNLCCYAIGEDFYIILTSLSAGNSLTQSFIQNNQFLSARDWHLSQIKRPRVRITPETRGLFLPHRLDLHLQNYISFDKGCYKGQEIVARTHYKAKLKHKMISVALYSTVKPVAGEKIFNPMDNAEIGECIDVVSTGEHQYLLAASVLMDYEGEMAFGIQSERMSKLL